MKILQIGKYPKEHCGGIETVIFSLASCLKRSNAVEVLVSNTKFKGYESKTSDGYIIKCLPLWAVIAAGPISLGLIGYLKGKKDTDIIQISHPNPFAVLAYLIAKPKGKLIIWYHNDIVGRAIGKFAFGFLLRKILKYADSIVVTSVNYKDTSAELKNLHNKITVIPLGISLDDFNNEYELREAKNIKDEYGGPLVLFIGRLVYYKGLKYLIKAMENISAKLLIIGSGPEEKMLIKMVKKLGLENKIFFKHVEKNKSIARYMHACDVFVLPSVYRSEAFGIVILEAMACAKPVVTTELGTGTSFACQDGITGLVVPAKNPEALTSAINRILGDQELARRFGEAGRRRLEEHFTLEKMGDSFLKLYNQLLSGENH